MSTESDNVTTLNDLCKSCNLNIPEPILKALEKAYTSDECVIIISKSLSTKKSLKIMNPIVIDQYIKSKNKIGSTV
jgi:hypothetical protein